jgi:hypothetical protein
MVSRYFRRAARFIAKGDQLFVVDRNSPRVITMDPWPQLVFLAADGEQTVQQFVDRLGASYAGGTPAGLSAQVEGIIAQLVQEGVLETTDRPSPLPYYLAISVSEQDPARAKSQMIADGFIPQPAGA